MSPSDLPAGTVQIGGAIDWFSISLGVKSENLVPDEVTAILLREPDQAWQKDKPLYRGDGSLMRIPKFGSWRVYLKPEDTDEWDCCEAILELLGKLPSDPTIWHGLADKYEVSVSVGLSLTSSIRGFELSAAAMSYLGERRITAGFDVYYDPDTNGR